MAYTTINKSTDYFNTKLYTGGSGNTAHTGVGFQPDLVWIKERTRVRNHAWFDAIRGARYWIGSNSNGAQDYNSGAYLVSLDSDGFTTTDTDVVGKNGLTYASWNWKANGAGSANTAGSINSTVSANTTSGFSIVKWTGTGSAGTIGHGLGSAPLIVLYKSISGSSNWYFYTYQIDGSSDELALNLTEGKTDRSLTAPTSSLFYVDGQSERNGSGATQLAYCFAEKTGYSKFGSYVGNGSADGAFIYTGFKPAVIIIKRTDSTGNWNIIDNKRLGRNPNNPRLTPNANTAEDSADATTDILSNGFKLKSTSQYVNYSGGSYIYMAFGQSIVGSNNVPCTAR